MLQLEEVRCCFANKARIEQRQYLLDIVSASAKRTQSGVIIDGYALCGIKVCKKAFLEILGISHKRLRIVTRLLNAGATSARATTSISKKRKQTQRMQDARSWLSSYVKRIGDRMPHTEQIHLPSFLTKKSVYEMMVIEFNGQGMMEEDVLSMSHFYTLWATEFSHCVIPKVIN